MAPRSTTAAGRLVGALSQSHVSWPPASTRASLPYWSRSPSASSMLAGWKSSNAGVVSGMRTSGACASTGTPPLSM